jgi:hypothetical protein
MMVADAPNGTGSPEPTDERKGGMRMPTETAARETREMRLISRVLTKSRKGTLAEFLAKRRLPGDTWRSWEQISFDLHGETGELITREGIRRWANHYGIPLNTMPGDGDKLVAKYRTAVKSRAGLDL